MVRIAKVLGLAIALAVLQSACSNEDSNQVQADLPIDTATVAAGQGNSVAMQGQPLPLSGLGAVVLDQPLPAGIVSSPDLKSVDLSETHGKVRIISVVPSLDTPTCDKQTHELSEENDGLDQHVELISVSMDLPFAQARFAKEAKIGNVQFLSDYKNRQFGSNTGLIIEPLALLARAVIVTDKDNIVRYLQVVPEVTALPDMQAAMRAARELL